MFNNSLIFLSSILFVAVVVADKFCPDPISSSGVYPAGATNLTQFPDNLFCNVRFDIPAGKVLRLEVSASYNAQAGDSLTAVNVLGDKFMFPSSPSRTQAFFPADTAVLHVVTASTKTTAKYFVKYEFIDLSTYTQTVKLTGSYLSLNLPPQTITTFKSDNDFVSLTVGNTIPGVDPYGGFVFVYEGDNIMGTNFVGNLNTYVSKGTVKSLGKAVTLVNFYGTTKATSWVIANDYTRVQPYIMYQLIPLTFLEQRAQTIDTVNYGSIAVTVICTDCQEVYLLSMVFGGGDGGKHVPTVDLVPMTPTHDTVAQISYQDFSTKQSLFPQIVPAPVFTMVIKNAHVGFTMTPNGKSLWSMPYHDRRGIIISPNIWSPSLLPTFDYTFTLSDTKFFGFEVNTNTLKMMNGEVVTMQIGANGVKPTNVTLACIVTAGCDQSNTNPLVANGTYLEIKNLESSMTSKLKMSFHMIDYDQSPTMPSITTTQKPIETTTKLGQLVSIFSALMISFFVFLC